LTNSSRTPLFWFRRTAWRDPPGHGSRFRSFGFTPTISLIDQTGLLFETWSRIRAKGRSAASAQNVWVRQILLSRTFFLDRRPRSVGVETLHLAEFVQGFGSEVLVVPTSDNLRHVTIRRGWVGDQTGDLRPWREAIGFKASRTAPANNIFCIALICSSFAMKYRRDSAKSPVFSGLRRFAVDS
jgi:hypothetical protein